MRGSWRNALGYWLGVRCYYHVILDCPLAFFPNPQASRVPEAECWPPHTNPGGLHWGWRWKKTGLDGNAGFPLSIWWSLQCSRSFFFDFSHTGFCFVWDFCWQTQNVNTFFIQVARLWFISEQYRGTYPCKATTPDSALPFLNFVALRPPLSSVTVFLLLAIFTVLNNKLLLPFLDLPTLDLIYWSRCDRRSRQPLWLPHPLPASAQYSTFMILVSFTLPSASPPNLVTWTSICTMSGLMAFTPCSLNRVKSPVVCPQVDSKCSKPINSIDIIITYVNSIHLEPSGSMALIPSLRGKCF